jgi:hypothetical protein
VYLKQIDGSHTYGNRMDVVLAKRKDESFWNDCKFYNNQIHAFSSIAANKTPELIALEGPLKHSVPAIFTFLS